MDPHLEPSTRLYNYILLCFTQCHLYSRAWYIFSELSRSLEGPDNATLNVVFELAGRDLAWGMERGGRLWDRVRRTKVELTDRNVAAWVEYMGRYTRADEALREVRGWVKDGGVPGIATVGALWGVYHGSKKIEEVEEMLEREYPAPWAQLQQVRQEEADRLEREKAEHGPEATLNSPLDQPAVAGQEDAVMRTFVHGGSAPNIPDVYLSGREAKEGRRRRTLEELDPYREEVEEEVREKWGAPEARERWAEGVRRDELEGVLRRMKGVGI